MQSTWDNKKTNRHPLYYVKNVDIVIMSWTGGFFPNIFINMQLSYTQDG